jgi:endonuclease YncB( thermonuclease family)
VSASCSVERIHIQRSIFPLLIVLVCLSAAAIGQKAPPSKPFERFDGCVLKPDQWTNGDSFRVQLPNGHYETFRLYFVDTTESRSSGNRSDEQAAYFGLTRAQAVQLGNQAKTFTAHVLHSRSRSTHVGGAFLELATTQSS